MELWRLWLRMAMESQRAALASEAEGCCRSSVSRYYYAAFQAISAVLLYAGCVPPEGEEAWSHAQTPDMLRVHFEPYVRKRDVRKSLASDLSELYKLRIYADYRGRVVIDGRLAEARRCSNRLVKVASEILPQE
jgi:uncharacterized protein (UPF0332 family)